MAAETFYKAYDDDACTDWNKMEPDGTPFGGAWRAPQGSSERKNAF